MVDEVVVTEWGHEPSPHREASSRYSRGGEFSLVRSLGSDVKANALFHFEHLMLLRREPDKGQNDEQYPLYAIIRFQVTHLAANLSALLEFSADECPLVTLSFE